jgi:hypothetical protein
MGQGTAPSKGRGEEIGSRRGSRLYRTRWSIEKGRSQDGRIEGREIANCCETSIQLPAAGVTCCRARVARVRTKPNQDLQPITNNLVRRHAVPGGQLRLHLDCFEAFSSRRSRRSGRTRWRNRCDSWSHLRFEMESQIQVPCQI